jgi:hypothetical protein
VNEKKKEVIEEKDPQGKPGIPGEEIKKQQDGVGYNA